MFNVYHGNCRINLYVSFYTAEEAVEYLLDVNSKREDPAWKRLSRDGKLSALYDDDWGIYNSEQLKPKKPARKKPAVKKAQPGPTVEKAQPGPTVPKKWSVAALIQLHEMYVNGFGYKDIAEKLKNEGLKTDCDAGKVVDRLYKMKKTGEIKARA